MTLQLGPVIGKVGGAGFYGRITTKWSVDDADWHTPPWGESVGDVMVPPGTYKVIGQITTGASYRRWVLRFGSVTTSEVSGSSMVMPLDATVTITAPTAVQFQATGTSLNRALDAALVAVIPVGG